MNGFLFDTSVLLDIATSDPVWYPWSAEQLRLSASKGPICINPIIYTELAPAFRSLEELDLWLDPVMFKRLPLPYALGWKTALAHLRYRRLGGVKTTPLPDFFIGAQAEVEKLTLVTRDASRFRTYFPEVKLIAPD